MRVKTKADYRTRRHLRLRQEVCGTAARPRMSVYVSNRQAYVQFIDDEAGRTLASASTLSAASRANFKAETAADLGQRAAAAAKTAGITAVVFDRGGFTYGKRLKALADAARAAGLQF